MDRVFSVGWVVLTAVLLLLPLGSIPGVVGIVLARKYDKHPNENTIVVSGMVIASVLVVCIWIAIFFLSKS